ncbi:histidine triad nucleotide-binding protein 3-like isoform X1 [Manduca sexta]|uniref:histidine triad nucleotide-binding protein 3-like isoform X1 n=2 Tax=Manduca sexta TaxID=7130 RepID=UPI00188F39BD|nr:histidine triad nucleotide-binding protein 3-like isoform X1 [Manduca sexta]XP_037303052.1 histidine triad nucleotide-binding protein 3-like isoform X1 [Manduca sexta]
MLYVIVNKIVKNKTITICLLGLILIYFYPTQVKMTDQPPRSSCIFCNIVNKLENTEILYEDEDICIFRDIKPASKFHILTIPKRHIEDVKSLTSSDKPLVEKMLSVSKNLLTSNNLTVEDARFGYHWPPFRSVRHLHLHTIAPESEMGLISRMVFKKNSYWFVTPEYVVSRL